MIEPTDITGVDESTARRVLAYVRSIVSCLNTLDGDDRLTAIAILQGVALEVVARGSRFVSGQRIDNAQVNYRDVGSCFTADDRDGLRTLCAAATAAVPAGLPVGSFPDVHPFRRIWPDEPC